MLVHHPGQTTNCAAVSKLNFIGSKCTKLEMSIGKYHSFLKFLLVCNPFSHELIFSLQLLLLENMCS
jgi:hypothetical protein